MKEEVFVKRQASHRVKVTGEVNVTCEQLIQEICMYSKY